MNDDRYRVNDDRYIAAVDAGNSHLDIALVDTVRLVALDRLRISARAGRAQIARGLRRVGGHEDGSARRFVAVGGSRGIVRQVRDAAGVSRRVVGMERRTGLPIAFRYQPLKRLGADRLADALWFHAAYPRCDGIIIDAGTAITIDCISRKHGFLGGAILPGPSTQFAALAGACSALPAIQPEHGPVAYPGTTTAACLQSGILQGLAGAVERIIEEAVSRCTAGPRIIATGGAWGYLRDRMKSEIHYIPDVTVVGIALYGKWRIFRNGR